MRWSDAYTAPLGAATSTNQADRLEQTRDNTPDRTTNEEPRSLYYIKDTIPKAGEHTFKRSQCPMGRDSRCRGPAPLTTAGFRAAAMPTKSAEGISR
jgi:hypothetical protein